MNRKGGRKFLAPGEGGQNFWGGQAEKLPTPLPVVNEHSLGFCHVRQHILPLQREIQDTWIFSPLPKNVGIFLNDFQILYS